MAYYVRPDGGSTAAAATAGADRPPDGHAAGANRPPDGHAADGNGRKGRPRGSKNKSAASSSGHRCGTGSLTYTSGGGGPAVCKSCGRTYEGDPLAHCRQHHRTACPVCGLTFKPPLAAHIRSHGGGQRAWLTVECRECYECADKLADAEAAAQHALDKHLPAAETTCPACGVRLPDRTAVAAHLADEHCRRRTFSHPAVYRCRVCRAGFKSQVNVLRHACNRIKTTRCDRCRLTFPSKARYAFHLQFHGHDAPPMHLRCDLCLAEFGDECHLYDHIRFRHESHDKAVCEVCGRTFKSSMGLNIHRRYHNGSRDYACRSCDKSFLNRSTLREHEISHMDVKPFQCRICGQYLSRASRLRSHVKTHKAAESAEQLCHGCARCGFVAPSAGLLAEHRRETRHGGGGDDDDDSVVYHRLSSVVKCEYCDATYTNSAWLDEHRDAAHGDGDGGEPFICVVCSSTFSSYSRLTTHKLTHGINMESTLPDGDDADGDADARRQDRDRFVIPQYFSCRHCAKKCLHYTYFCLHRRLKHPPAVETYACDKCEADFKTSWRLSYHKKTVHGQQPSERPPASYRCTVCSREFVKIGALNLHKTRTHIGTGSGVCRYLCHRCGKFFSSQCSLRNHDGKVHGGGDGEGGAAVDDGGESAAVQCRQPKTVRWPRTRPVDEHRATDHRDGPANVIVPAGTVCVLCDKSRQDSVQLKIHLDDHVARGEAVLCAACYVPFVSSAALAVHSATHHYHHQPVAAADGNRDPPPNIRFCDVGAEADDADVKPLMVYCSQTIDAGAAATTTTTTTTPPMTVTTTTPPMMVTTTMTTTKTTTTMTTTASSPRAITAEEAAADDDTAAENESCLLDELLAILSSPHTSTAMDEIDFALSNGIDDIFNSIGDT